MILSRKLMVADASGGIQYVGGRAAGKAGATSGNSTIALNSGLVGGIASSVSDGDLVIAAYATGSTADRTLDITDGTNNYTLIGSELYANDTYDTNLRVGYKFVSGDTATTFGPTGNAADAGAMAVCVFRSVNTTTPLDVAAVTATGIDSPSADPPSITPVTVGAFVVAVAGTAHNLAFQNYTAGEGLTAFGSTWGSDTNDTCIGFGHIPDWVSGVVDPSPFTFPSGGTPTDFSWAAVTIALRPV